MRKAVDCRMAVSGFVVIVSGRGFSFFINNEILGTFPRRFCKRNPEQFCRTVPDRFLKHMISSVQIAVIGSLFHIQNVLEPHGKAVFNHLVISLFHIGRTIDDLAHF